MAWTSAVLGSLGDRRIDPEAQRKLHLLPRRKCLLVEAEARRLMEILAHRIRRHIVQRHTGDRRCLRCCARYRMPGVHHRVPCVKFSLLRV